MAREYGDQSYLEEFKQGRYPAIHDGIYQLVMEEHGFKDAYLDLCGCTGLLGARITQITDHVWTIDGDADAVRRGMAARVPQEMVHLRLNDYTLDAFVALLESHRTNTIVARRCLSELWTVGAGFRLRFAKAIHPLITTIYVEGRVRRSNATHPFPDVDAEVKVLTAAKRYRVAARRGEIIKLVRT